MKTIIIITLLLVVSLNSFAAPKPKLKKVSKVNTLLADIAQKKNSFTTDITFASGLLKDDEKLPSLFEMNKTYVKNSGFEYPNETSLPSLPLTYAAVLKFDKELPHYDENGFADTVLKNAMDLRLFEQGSDFLKGQMIMPLGPTMGLGPKALECQFGWKATPSNTDSLMKSGLILTDKKPSGFWHTFADSCNAILVFQSQSIAFETKDDKTFLIVRGVFFVKKETLGLINKVPFLSAENLFADKIQEQIINIYQSLRDYK